MFKNYFKFLFLLSILSLIFSCGTDDSYIALVPDEEPDLISPVVFDIERVPYQTLSEYNFFKESMKDLDPVYGVLPYELITPLFSDYALKKRFVWMPSGVSASYVDDYDVLDFPTGAVLIKNFYYENVLPDLHTQLLETRLLIKKDEGWIFANYKWNEAQTEAYYDLDGSFVNVDIVVNDVQRSINYNIPSGSQCHTCHKSQNDVGIPIGPKPQNLNRMMPYADGTKNQFQKWVEMGYLANNYPSQIDSMVNWEDESKSLVLRARSYLDMNCAHCHSDNRHCDYRPIRFAFEESSNLTNLGVCVQAHDIFDPGLTQIVSPGSSERSVLAFRLNSIAPEFRMPLLGRTTKHDEGVQLIEEWINSLNIICE